MNAYKFLAAQGIGLIYSTAVDVFMRSWLKNVKSNQLKPASYDRTELTRAYVYLHACLQHAVNTKKLSLNPCDAVVLPLKKKQKQQSLYVSLTMLKY